MDTSIKPLQAGTLHPAGRLRHAPGKEIESSTDAGHQSHVEFRQHLRHEPVLFGASESHPHDVGFRRPYLLDQLLLFRRRQCAKGRLKRPGNVYARKMRLGLGAHRVCDTVSATIKKMPVSPLCRKSKYLCHQVRTINARDMTSTMQAAKPHHRHAVRGRKKAPIVKPLQLQIGPRLHDRMDTSKADIAFAPPLESIVNGCRRLRQIDCRNPHAEHVRARDGFGVEIHARDINTRQMRRAAETRGREKQNGGRPMTDVCSSRRLFCHRARLPHASYIYRKHVRACEILAAARGNSGRRHPSSAYVALPMRVRMSRHFAITDLLGIRPGRSVSACAAHARRAEFAHVTGCVSKTLTTISSRQSHHAIITVRAVCCARVNHGCRRAIPCNAAVQRGPSRRGEVVFELHAIVPV